MTTQLNNYTPINGDILTKNKAKIIVQEVTPMCVTFQNSNGSFMTLSKQHFAMQVRLNDYSITRNGVQIK